MRTKAIVICLLFSLPLLAQKKVIQPKEFPTGRPFSPGILSGNTLYVAGPHELLGTDREAPVAQSQDIHLVVGPRRERRFTAARV